ncbi:hypothetical protein PVAND_013947 [Polypedilum vanderplanki]|uniref:Elongation of very long chain fatty acids protein n=1 Tax=Polypedilum vanderplanki TaxID=319348 RepID=A0A9J6CRS3_POLVA|nr:hypothetical protein PVAND_013947 [Polypedilum vanderplanki]
MQLLPPSKLKFLESWTLFGDPMHLVTILVLYFSILKFGPILMRDRKPFQLTNFIKLYNVFQIVACCAFSYIAIVKYNYNVYYETWQCRTYDDFAKTPEELVGIFEFYWYYFILRTVELVETVFFVLRKKPEQASFLHIYHHVSTIVMYYLMNRYSVSPMESYVAILNNKVHILMYTYYLCSSFNSIKKKVAKFKPILTAVQIIQLMLILGQCFAAKFCGQNNLFYAFMGNISILLFFFGDFYYKTYLRKDKSEKLKQ